MRTLLVFGILVGCAGDPAIGPKPDAPEVNDPAYTVRSLKAWYLVGDAATPGQDVMTIHVDAPAGTEYVDGWIADLEPVRFARQPDGSHATQIAIADVPA